MKRLTHLLLSGLLIFLLLFSAGCAASPAASGESAGRVSLWVTREFGSETIFSAEPEMTPNQTVLGLLQEHLEVKTAFGGGFVHAINGLESGYRDQNGQELLLDWFYYVNGILVDRGAADYIPAAGDVIWWDYRPWGHIPASPAVVGAFPQPFTGGYRGKNPGTLILAADNCHEPAEQLARFLQEQGAGPVTVIPYREEEAINRSQMVLVVALWEQLHASPFWQGIQQHRGRTGWFAELTAVDFYPLDLFANRQGEGFGEKTGAVLATGTGLGDPHPLWLVTATDPEGLTGAVNALVNTPEQFAKTAGALVINGDVLALPLTQQR